MTEMPHDVSPSPYQQPAVQDPMAEQKPKTPAWAITIGVISIVLASYGLICTPVVMAGMVFHSAFQEPLSEFPSWHRVYTLGASVVGIVIAVVELTAGISLLRRASAARTLHLVYAIAAVTLCLVGNVLMLTSVDWANLSPDRIPGFIGGLLGGWVALGYPVFVIVWFMRDKIKREVANWR